MTPTLLDRAKAGELLTPDELSTLLKRTVSWIYEKRRPRCVNPIPAIPMGRGSLFFRWSDITTWLDSCRSFDAESLAERRTRPKRPRKKAKSVAAKEEQRRKREFQELSEFAQLFFATIDKDDEGILASDSHDREGA